MCLLSHLIAVARQNSTRIAAIDDAGTRSYSDILAGSLAFADLYSKSTAAPVVGYMAPTSALAGMAMIGAWLARRTFVSLNYLLGREELQYCLTHSTIDLLLTTRPMLEGVGGPSVIPPHIRVIFLEDALPTLPPLPTTTPLLDTPPTFPDDHIATILYTSGTSGMPKGVPLTFPNLHSNTLHTITAAEFSRDDVFISVMPQFHSFGLCALTIFPLAAGATVIYTPRFVPTRVLELFRAHKPTVFMAVPTMYAALLNMKDATRQDFTSFRLCFSGGEPLPHAVRDGVHARFGVQLCEGYGMTETSPVAAWTMPHYYRPGFVGRPIPEMDIRIVDDNDNLVPDNVEGEVLMAGPNVFPGYFRDRPSDATTFKELTINGVARRYIRSGDIGLFDKGHLAITGRKKEMIIVGGFNVFPRTIEEILNAHPTILDSGVVGKTDGLRGEVPIAFVELKEGQPFDEPTLRAYCRQHLANFKVPKATPTP